ncbi:chorismate mutase [uncultured Streptococcus sp.]|uniref:chorismate mutase n=1 Tax=uncultured Streptococcus sp. TaxID=83427 RepID=UPI0027DE34C6|nr:chorismate mutase [uncultured Streptococcus sp.]
MDLNLIRQDIDALDKELVALLEKRMNLVTQVTAFKKETGKPVLDTAREEAVLATVANRVVNKDFEATIVNTFADIMKNSRDYQKSKLD